MGKAINAGFLIAGAGVGAGCMYLMDPDRGRSRRAVLRDRTRSAYRDVRTSLERAQADLVNRANGLHAHARSVVHHEPVGDDQLIARVRANLGRLVSHPHAIDVIARDGTTTLSGDVLEDEAKELVSQVGTIQGVSLVCDHLLRHRDAAKISSLQGGRERRAGSQVSPQEWPPAFRMLSGVAGVSLEIYGLFSSSRKVKAVALPFGLGLLARGISSGKRKEMAR